VKSIEFSKFDAALSKVFTVSRADVKAKLEAEKAERKQRPKKEKKQNG
jgi:hypothetical protein